MRYLLPVLLTLAAGTILTPPLWSSQTSLPVVSAEESAGSADETERDVQTSPPQVVVPVSQVSKAPPATTSPASAAQPLKPAGAPVRLNIPTIGLDSRVVQVGTNSAGEMDVPSGKTQDIGWYSKGVVPGEVGSAVFAAHIFAGFSALHKAAPGDELFVETENGGRLRFVVTETEVYKLGDLSPEMLFSRTGGRYLHLITCAGAPTPDGSTYTHRLVVYATLAP